MKSVIAKIGRTLKSIVSHAGRNLLRVVHGGIEVLRRRMRRRRPRSFGKKRFVHLFIAFLLICTGVGVVSDWTVRRAGKECIFTSVDAVPARYTAIVPGALVYPNHRPSAVLADRLQTALDLYTSKKVRKILLSGDHAARAYDEVNTMYRWMRGRGVPAEDLFGSGTLRGA